MIRWRNMGFEDFGLEFGNPDFVSLLNVMVRWISSKKTDDFVPLIQKCNNTPEFIWWNLRRLF